MTSAPRELRYLFTIISYLIGVFIFATIVGQVGNVITNRNANRLEFERLLDGAKTYMRHHKVPGGMKRRVLRWYDYSWSRGRIQGGGDINTALGLLPDKLKTELALHVNLSVLKKVTIFQECQPEFLHDLVLKMKAYIFTPGDLICRKGEVAREMFIIADGILDVISETGRVLTTMKAGDFFGEIGILNLDGLNKRTADVRSVGYSELFSLSREDVLTAMKDYPEAQEILQNLGRKRLMEAKNATKIYKAQVKQAKDHDSSGDSDTTGIRIVEKLRSDVKGLKNALRRSRRGSRIKETFDHVPENCTRKTSNKKHSILRRMSHVQSSDEYETETAQSPIGAGLPLLQRLKLLKEKQEKEREEKEKSKSFSHSLGAKNETFEMEIKESGLPFTQKLKLLKQKEGKDIVISQSSAMSSTVRTQVTGVRFDKLTPKSNSIISSKISEKKLVKTAANDELIAKKKDIVEYNGKPTKASLKEKLKLLNSNQVKEKNIDSDTTSSSKLQETQFNTSNYVPLANEAEIIVPNLLGIKIEVPKSKDGWKILKKSSVTSTKFDKKIKPKENKLVRKLSKKGTYLSKSDTVLEKQTTVENEEEKRPRSISPSDGSKILKKSLKQTVENIIKEKRTRSLSHTSAKAMGENVNFWEFPKESIGENTGETKETLKKYDSISDLSPEYSGLPFVKKLKILNERQKLAELEKELLVRSASLDVPDQTPKKRENILVRSQSEASTIKFSRIDNSGLQTNTEAKLRDVTSYTSNNNWLKSRSDIPVELRNLVAPNTQLNSQIHADCSIASPESNETLERKHLKSILKKLSAEGSTSDEEQIHWNIRNSGSKRSNNAELKKLMRAPTIEGYAARHKKFTKSVTFDSDTLSSPPDPTPFESELEESKDKSFTPMSPTAILTLQLSNLSMIPLVSSKKKDGNESLGEERNDNPEKTYCGPPAPKAIEKLQDKIFNTRKIDKEIESLSMPYVAQEIIEKNFKTLPFLNSQDDESINEIKEKIEFIVHGLLREAQTQLQSQYTSFQLEVRKRDEIIFQLQSKIQQLENFTAETFDSRIKSSEINPDNSETGSDTSNAHFLRGGSFETILGNNTLVKKSSKAYEISNEMEMTSSRNNELGLEEPPFDCLENLISQEQASNVSVMDGDIFETRDKLCLLSNPASSSPLKRRFIQSIDFASDEEIELFEMSKSSHWDDLKRDCHKSETKLKKNFSVDKAQFQTPLVSQERSTGDAIKNTKTQMKESLKNRMTNFQRSFSCSNENNDFIALDIDNSSGSSDVENPHNKDWEVQMLLEELEKKETAKKVSLWHVEDEEWETEAEIEAERLEKLQKEVNTLKQMVHKSDLTRLTSSELDVLETIIESKHQKISQIAKANSLDNKYKYNESRKQTNSLSLDNKLRETNQKKKSTLRHKIGQALSFDFHDIDYKKSKSTDQIKLKSFSLRKQKTISSHHQEQKSLHSLWHTSSLLRNRVLQDSSETNKSLANRSLHSINSRFSLPILLSSSPRLEKKIDIRTSLPTLSAKEFQSNALERLTSSVSSSEDLQHESDFKQSSDSVFEEPEMNRDLRNLNILNLNSPSTSGLATMNDSLSNNSLNSFIKSVGQRVKQVMAGDMSTIKSQVPTISKLCEEQSILKNAEVGCTEDFTLLSEEDVMAVGNESSKGLDPFDCDSKTDLLDL